MNTKNVMLIAIAISGDRKKRRRYKNVEDRGTAFNMEGRCEYIVWAAVDSRQGVVLQIWGRARC